MAITVTVPAAANALRANANLTSQELNFDDIATATSDGITALQRIADINPNYLRLHMGTDGGVVNVALPMHVAFQGQAKYDFTNLNGRIQNVFSRVKNATLMMDFRYLPDSMWTGTFIAFGTSRANQGWTADTTYATFATYMANMIRYYNKNAVGFVNGPPNPATPPANTGPILYWEMLNELDFGGEEPWSTPTSLPAPPAPTLNKVAGGTLAAGTYTYQLAGIDDRDESTAAGPTASITIGPGDVASGIQSINVTWSANKNLNMEPFAYRIFGRSAAPTELLVIGRDNAQAFNWTDTGSIVPGVAIPPTTSSVTAPQGVFSPYEYLKMWDIVVPAMKAVDSTIKVGGPASSNLLDLQSGLNHVNPKLATTGPGQTTYRDNRTYLQVLAQDAVNRPDFFSLHQYGNGPGTDASYFNDIPNTFVAGFNANVWPITGNVPVHLTEWNLDPAPDAGQRANFPYGAAFMASVIAQLLGAGTNFQNLQGLQYFTLSSAGFGILSDGSGLNVPPGADGRPFCAYWVERLFVNLFPPGSSILQVSGIPASTDVLAVQSSLDSTKIKVLVSNRLVPSTLVNYTVGISGGTVNNIRVRVIDQNLNTVAGLAAGPGITSSSGVQSVTFTINGYGAAIIEFDLLGQLPPGVPSTNAQGWRR